MTRHPDPPAWSSHPVTFNPDRGRAWAHNPMPGHPCVARASPLPVAIRPNVARPWGNGSRLYPNWWGRLSNQNLSCNGLRRNGASCHRPCDFSCRSRDRGFPRRSQLIPTAPANKKAFSYHSSSLGSFCPSNSALFLEAKTRSRYMSGSPIFDGWEPHKWKVCVPRLGGFGTVERNTGRWPVSPAGILPAAASERSQRSKNSAGRTNWKVCVPRLTGRRKEKAMKEAQLRSRSDGTKPNLIR